jgi:hypothetical protein
MGELICIQIFNQICLHKFSVDFPITSFLNSLLEIPEIYGSVGLARNATGGASVWKTPNVFGRESRYCMEMRIYYVPSEPWKTCLWPHLPNRIGNPVSFDRRSLCRLFEYYDGFAISARHNEQHPCQMLQISPRVHRSRRCQNNPSIFGCLSRYLERRTSFGAEQGAQR